MLHALTKKTELFEISKFVDRLLPEDIKLIKTKAVKRIYTFISQNVRKYYENITNGGLARPFQ